MKQKRILTLTISSLFAIIASHSSAANINLAIYNTNQTQTETTTTETTTNGTTTTGAVTTDQTQVTVVDDNKITNAVKSKLRDDHLLSHSKIEVVTTNGVVYLSGNVKTEQEASKAIENANSVEGVRDVDASKLVVESSTQPFTDTVITAKVKGAFIREKLFGKEPIEVTTIIVETTNGVVYLMGTAESPEIVKNAEKLAKSVSGVKKVENKVQVVKKANNVDNEKTDTKINNKTDNKTNNKTKY